MRYRVRVARRGGLDITEIALWLQERMPTAATNWLDAVEVALASLATRPQRCRAAPEAELIGAKVRQLMLDKYRILFVIEGDTVVLLHVRHGARQAWDGADEPPL